MPIEPGTRIGPYQVLAPLGAGRMGEVYAAGDARRRRRAAIKVLPDEVARDPDRLARFERATVPLVRYKPPLTSSSAAWNMAAPFSITGALGEDLPAEQARTRRRPVAPPDSAP